MHFFSLSSFIAYYYHQYHLNCWELNSLLACNFCHHIHSIGAGTRRNSRFSKNVQFILCMHIIWANFHIAQQYDLWHFCMKFVSKIINHDIKIPLVFFRLLFYFHWSLPPHITFTKKDFIAIHLSEDFSYSTCSLLRDFFSFQSWHDKKKWNEILCFAIKRAFMRIKRMDERKQIILRWGLVIEHFIKG